VRVYTDLPGVRNFQLFDDGGNLLNNTVVNVTPDSMDVVLNWDLTPGINYYIGTDASYNQVIPNGTGGANPRLKRNSVGVSYPYTIDGTLSITGNSIGSQYYYYFYDWKVQNPSLICTTDRIPVFIDFAVSTNDVVWEGFSIFPNPSTGLVQITSTEFQGTQVYVMDMMGRTLLTTELTSQTTSLPLNGISAGVYQVLLVNEKGKRVEKLLIK
jgi:hypothetical protein